MQQSEKVQLVINRQAAIRNLVAVSRVPEDRWHTLAWPNGVYNPEEVKGDLNKHAELIKRAKEYSVVRNLDYLCGVTMTSIMFGVFSIATIVTVAMEVEIIPIITGPIAAIFGIALGGVLYHIFSNPSVVEIEKAYLQALKTEIVVSCELPQEQDANDLYQVKIDASTVMPLDRSI